jgi:spermidine synthase
MLAWQTLDQATIPDGGTLLLRQRGSEFAIVLGGNELMNSRRSGSETALATLASARLKGRDSAQILIGGLGMGFTLRAALAALGGQARIVVAELVPAVAAWAAGPLADLHGDSLNDPRVSLVISDVSTLMAEAKGTYDAILLDVDNGPGGVSRTANDRLYDRAGLQRARAALAPGGVLAVWSAHPDAPFANRLRQGGFSVEDVEVFAHGNRGARHTIWLATRE